LPGAKVVVTSVKPVATLDNIIPMTMTGGLGIT